MDYLPFIFFYLQQKLSLKVQQSIQCLQSFLSIWIVNVDLDYFLPHSFIALHLPLCLLWQRNIFESWSQHTLSDYKIFFSMHAQIQLVYLATSERIILNWFRQLQYSIDILFSCTSLCLLRRTIYVPIMSTYQTIFWLIILLFTLYIIN